METFHYVLKYIIFCLFWSLGWFGYYVYKDAELTAVRAVWVLLPLIAPLFYYVFFWW